MSAYRGKRTLDLLVSGAACIVSAPPGEFAGKVYSWGVASADGHRIRPCQEQDRPQLLVISPATVCCLIGAGTASIKEHSSNRSLFKARCFGSSAVLVQ
jgi:hypothetical protein